MHTKTYGLHVRGISTRALVLAVTLLAAALQGQDGSDEFDGSGYDTVRVENEAKLTVPDDIVEPVWDWLVERYRDCSWIDRDGHRFRSSFGDEDFTDRYFDDGNLTMLGWDSGVRHRSRIVNSGPSMAKHGRQLLQIKLNRGDESGMNRSEIKFKIDPPSQMRHADDLHPMLGLLDRGDRDAARQRFLELGLDPYDFRPVLTIEQNRRRIYLADQHAAFATITLDRCSCSDYGTDLRWTEIELELNENRYTEAGPERRAWMERVSTDIQEDLLAVFPAIFQDQTPKYTKAFGWLEETSWWPVRTLIAWDVTPSDVVAASAAGFALLVVFGALGLTARRRRRREHMRQLPSFDPSPSTG